MPDENEVNITKNRRLLEAIRKEREKIDVSTQSGSGVGSGYVASDDNRVRQTTGRDDSNNRESRAASNTSRESVGHGREDRGNAQGVYEGIRPSDRPGFNTSQGAYTGDRRGEKEPVSFRLKGLFNRKPQEPVKLFSQVEAEAEYEKIYDVYFYGSGLLDDVLEICVKDHEPVQIWQLEPDEAKTLATMHLQRATYDKKAAASARQLIALYDRLYFYILAGPRIKNTYTHVKIHGGFSFR